ncbi:CatB-related O-acetyltransferase [Yoonia sp. 208BN28-4]|uniref:CatB-related O-acetyltransferase n=1 Tax=Yoonia sp. 208BN28-4 TaxID=3126505 RepID=UPI0030A60489
MTDAFAKPDTQHPVILPDGTAHQGTVFLQAVIDNPQFVVGRYSYASAHVPPADWGAALAPYLFPFSPETLRIGRFCQIADGVQFITSSANHRYDGFSSYPFGIFSGGLVGRPSMPDPGSDTVIGHDVWLGQGAKVMPGAVIGNGVIVGAGAVVSGKVPDYAIIAGNPARIRRMRFDEGTVAALNDIAWWNWPIETIIAHEVAIVGADLAALREVSV